MISGKAQHGKDTAASILREIFEENGKSVLITHYGDLVKYICKTFFGWDGKKDEYGRNLLQYVGTDVIRSKDPDYWVKFVNGIISFFSSEWDLVIIPDTRFPNEIEFLKSSGLNVIHIRVTRSDFISPLTEKQKNHPSETALDHYEADYYINNDGTITDLKQKLFEWVYEVGGLRQMSFSQ